MERITSFSNSKVKLVHRLRNKRGRQLERRFVVEYQRDLKRAIIQGYELEFLLICPELLGNHAIQIHSANAAFEVTPQVLKRITFREKPSGMLAVLKARPAKVLRDLEKAKVDSAIVLVDPHKPGNIGALLRTGDATGIGAMILAECALDLYNPNIIRNSAGACFCENIYQLSSAEALSYFRERRFQLIAADGEGESKIFDLDLRQKTAVVLGTEDVGLSSQWLDNCHRRVQIPMAGALTDSLNLSVSGAIFMYEILRQRQSV